MSSSEVILEIEQRGFAIIPDVLSESSLNELREAISQSSTHPGVRRRESVYAIRSLLDAVPSVARLARSQIIRSLVAPILGAECFPVRGILFDKTADANWNVTWHQDMTIAVREKRETPGYGPWSEKAGVVHVQPPVSILEKMLSVRLHLDDCGEDNGPLQVLPGSHRIGRLSAEGIQLQRAKIPPHLCLVPNGGALLMRPLLLHASSAASSPRHRRVIHLDYADSKLPEGLEWQQSQVSD